MKIYKVGGYVRDKILNLDPKDCDYVVVGSNEKEMLLLGYEQVGKDFPVFLHPKTKDEYALARKETKSGSGYNGFTIETNNITLEEDLFRRDLTINAMALTKDDKLIDPYNGREDLKNKTLRHVSEHFCEDPVRILRICRFSARYNFSIASETVTLMINMVNNGEFDSLTKERVWKEFEKVLTEPYLKNFFFYLDKVGALEKLPGFESSVYRNELADQNSHFDIIKKHSINDHQSYFTNNLLYTFSNMEKKVLSTWKIPTEYIQKINIFQDYQHDNNFYQYLSVEDKLNFIYKTKSLHSNKLAQEIIYSTTLRQQAELNNEDFNTVFNNELIVFNQDTQLLKELDYKTISEECLKEKISPKDKIKEIQIEILKNNYINIIFNQNLIKKPKFYN